MDELWHYGTSGTLLGVVLWLVRHVFKAGELMERGKQLEDRLERLETDITRRLTRIETLLMEGKRI